MKLENGQKVSYEINEKKYPGIIKKTNIEYMPYEIEFLEKPIIDDLVVESLLIHKKKNRKIIGINIFKNE